MTERATTSVAPTDREADFVQSLQRGLAVIRAFDGESTTLTLGEVATATGLARAAARRFLLTLVDLGYVRVDARLFELSPRVLELGRAYLSSLRLPTIAHQTVGEPEQRRVVRAEQPGHRLLPVRGLWSRGGGSPQQPAVLLAHTS